MDKGIRKTRIGTVVSNKMKKTLVVRVERLAKHPLYGRVVKKAKKFKVHDEKNTAQIGDTIKIEECRPLSKDKRWKLIKIMQKGQPDLLAETAKKEDKK